MRIQQKLFMTLSVVFALLVGVSCGQKPEAKPDEQPVVEPDPGKPGQRRTHPQIADANGFEPKRHDKAQRGTLVAKVKFSVRDPEYVEDGPSPYVSIENPAKDIKFLDDSDEIVISSTELNIVVDYPVTGVWQFRITSDNPKGFTRAGLANGISRVYHFLYADEERTTKIKVIPLAQRKKLLNRNRTDGKYGIWGHDIGDLVLHTVELFRAADGRLYALLGIDS